MKAITETETDTIKASTTLKTASYQTAPGVLSKARTSLVKLFHDESKLVCEDKSFESPGSKGFVNRFKNIFKGFRRFGALPANADTLAHFPSVEALHFPKDDIDRFESKSLHHSLPLKLSNGELNRSNINVLNKSKQSNLTTLYNKKALMPPTRGHAGVDTRRIIVMTGFPTNSVLRDILPCVRGGPLERISIRDQNDSSSVELHFFFPEHAHDFIEYGKSGLLVHNGDSIPIEWASPFNTSDIPFTHPTLPKSLMASVYRGATRILVFIKEIPEKPVYKSKKKVYPNPLVNYSQDFNIRNVLTDFQILGNLIDFVPIVSKRLAFAISFDDVRTAIAVMKQCRTNGTRLHEKYKTWIIRYGKDVTDKPCLKP